MRSPTEVGPISSWFFSKPTGPEWTLFEPSQDDVSSAHTLLFLSLPLSMHRQISSKSKRLDKLRFDGHSTKSLLPLCCSRFILNPRNLRERSSSSSGSQRSYKHTGMLISDHVSGARAAVFEETRPAHSELGDFVSRSLARGRTLPPKLPNITDPGWGFAPSVRKGSISMISKSMFHPTTHPLAAAQLATACGELQVPPSSDLSRVVGVCTTVCSESLFII